MSKKGMEIKDLRKRLFDLLLILFGNTAYALGIVMFVLPADLITGGTTGLALSMEHYFGTSISLFVFCFNLAMFVIGVIFLGVAFALTTLVSTFYYPVILGILQGVPGLSSFTDDPMLCTVCGGLLIGFGIGVVIRGGASTGGMDIPPLILNKKFGIPVSVLLYGFDFTILILQMTFSDKEQILYGILLVLIYTVVLDKLLMMGSSQVQVKILSSQHERINEEISRKLDRGTTLMHATTGYMHDEMPMVLTVISQRQLNALNKLVMDIDPNAFMIINKVNEVKGRGFSLQKEYR